MAIVKLAELLARDEVIAFLRGVVASGRPGNAYLFHGPAGVGKGTAALAFARALLCEGGAAGAPHAAPSLFDAPAPAAPAPVADAPRDDACGHCAACLKTGALAHPDLRLLFPVSGEEKELDATVAETLAAMRTDPLFVCQYEKAASIRLSLTRDLLRDLAFRPFEAARRVVVVRDADRMREDQYSAHLKTLEEPGATTVWILTTSRQARVLAALSAGSLGRALVLREMDPIALRDEALALLEPAVRGDAAGLWKASQAFAKFGRAGRETLRRAIEFHQLWLRDLLRASCGAPREALIHRDREAEIRRLAEGLSATEIRRRLMVLEEMLRAIEGNVSPDLTLFSGVARLAGKRLGEGAWPAHAAARGDY